VDDNPFIQYDYIKTLNDIKKYDVPLYTVARWGRFGATGTRVLPQFEIADGRMKFDECVRQCGEENHYFGFDFGFEESYNAVISMCVSTKDRVLYIYDEIYMNRVTDDKFCNQPEMQALKNRISGLNKQGYNKVIVADNEDPKAITFYRDQGFAIRGCRNKFAGSRLSNTRKIKRFHRIIVHPSCKNTIRELKDLTYKKDNRGNAIYDQFNIDPHTFSAIWYALDMVSVGDVKERKFNSTQN
jgi:phage terminase large subunit